MQTRVVAAALQHSTVLLRHLDETKALNELREAVGTKASPQNPFNELGEAAGTVASPQQSMVQGFKKALFVTISFLSRYPS